MTDMIGQRTFAMADRIRDLLDEYETHEGVAILSMAIEIGRRIGAASDNLEIASGSFRVVQEIASGQVAAAMIEKASRASRA